MIFGYIALVLALIGICLSPRSAFSRTVLALALFGLLFAYAARHIG